MATISPIIPIPLPIRGVLADQSLRLIGSEGLADAYNWMYRNGRFTNRGGLSRYTVDRFGYGAPAAPGPATEFVFERPMGITTFGTDVESAQVVVGTDRGWWVLGSNGTLVDITDRDDELSSSLKTEQVIFRSLALTAATSTLVGVNGNDTAKSWDGNVANNYEEISDGSDTITAKSLISIFNRMLYLNVTYDSVDYPDGLMYTAYLTIDDFDPLYLVRLADTPGYIVGGMEFGNMAAAIYKSDAIYMCSAIGQPNAPFRFDLKLANIAGPVSPRSIIPINNNLHAFLAIDGDVVIFDGTTTRSLGPHIQAHFQKYMDFEIADQAFGYYDFSRKELFFVYPAYNATDTNHAVIINLNDPNFPTIWPIVYPINLGTGKVVMLNQSKTIGELAGTIYSLEGAIGDFGSYTYVPMLASVPPTVETSGTASSGGATSLVDSGAGWTANEWVGYDVSITDHTGIGQVREITANTTDTLTVTPAWDDSPDSTSDYEIVDNLGSHLFTTSGNDDEGTPIYLYLRTGWYDLGEITSWKTLKEIDHLFNAATGQEIDCTLMVSISGENAELTAAQTINLDQGPFKTYHRSTGRLFALVYDGDCDDEIEWLGSEAAIKVRGRR